DAAHSPTAPDARRPAAATIFSVSEAGSSTASSARSGSGETSAIAATAAVALQSQPWNLSARRSGERIQCCHSPPTMSASAGYTGSRYRSRRWEVIVIRTTYTSAQQNKNRKTRRVAASASRQPYHTAAGTNTLQGRNLSPSGPAAKNTSLTRP